MPAGLIVSIELFLQPAGVVLSKCCCLFFLIVTLDHELEHALEHALEDTLENTLENALELALLNCTLHQGVHWMLIGCAQPMFSLRFYVFSFIQSFVDASVACHFFLDCETPETTHKHTLALWEGSIRSSSLLDFSVD